MRRVNLFYEFISMYNIAIGNIFWQGAIICPYYMKTGTCKYGPTCKFDHPPPGEVMAMATSQSTTTSTGGEGKED